MTKTVEQMGGESNSENAFCDVSVAEWVKLIRSMNCALSVLSDQIPKLNKMLEDNMLQLGESFSGIADGSNKQSKNLDTITVESKQNFASIDVVSELNSIRGEISDAAVAKKVEELIANVSEREKGISELLKKVREISGDISGKVGVAIVGMQFQDRVSQNLVIMKNVVSEAYKYLEKTLDDHGSESANDGSEKSFDKDFAMAIMSFFTLGELRDMFLDKLKTRGYIHGPADLGLELKDDKPATADEIELF
jgi:archaellum component FlaC